MVRKYKVETRQGSRMSEGTGSDEAANQGEGREARKVSVRNGPGQPEGFQAGFEAAGPGR